MNPRFIDLPTSQQKKINADAIIRQVWGSSMKQLWKLAINYLLDAIDFFFVVPPSSGWSVWKIQICRSFSDWLRQYWRANINGFREHLLVKKLISFASVGQTNGNQEDCSQVCYLRQVLPPCEYLYKTSKKSGNSARTMNDIPPGEQSWCRLSRSLCGLMKTHVHALSFLDLLPVNRWGTWWAAAKANSILAMKKGTHDSIISLLFGYLESH